MDTEIIYQEKTFFFDTYALFEITRGNKNFVPYLKDIGIVTSRLNLMELYYRLVNLDGIDKAEFYFEKFRKFCIEIDDKILKKAMIFRVQQKRKDLSYVDCIGYIFAKYAGMKFLTGDIQFKDFENVEYVK